MQSQDQGPLRQLAALGPMAMASPCLVAGTPLRSTADLESGTIVCARLATAKEWMDARTPVTTSCMRQSSTIT